VPQNIAFSTLIPGPKMIWQFGELGYDYNIDYNGGRTNEKPSPFALGWLDIPERMAAYRAASKIVNLRKIYPDAFTSGTFTLNVSASDWTNGRKIKLTHNDLDMFVIGNFQSTNTVSVSADFQHTGVWYELLTGDELNISDANTPLSLPPGDVRIYTDRKIDIPNGMPSITRDDAVYVSISGGFAKVVSSENITALSVYNLQGVLLKKVANRNTINVGDLPSGLYLLEIQMSNKRIVKKTVIQK
jgi:hypothetical protein